jgi:hypothetical protein
MSRRARVDRLEHSERFGACPQCGIDSTAVSYEICWEDGEAEEQENEARVSSEPCPVCGARAFTVIDWDGIVEDEDEARAKAEHLRRIEAERAEYLKSRPDLCASRADEVTQPEVVPDYPPWGSDGGRGHR